MSQHLEKVLAHAEKQLALEGRKRPSDILALYKKFLKIEEHRLRLKHRAGGGGREIAHERVQLLDVILRQLFHGACRFCETEKKLAPAPLSVLAIGGYGRGELNPLSDVDIMFLHSGSDSTTKPFVTEVVEQILYMLWDVGFKVGHSTRTIAVAVAQANQDPLSKTALMESRLITGDKELFLKFKASYQRHCVDGQLRKYLLWRVEDQTSRHQKQGKTVYLQEPNIKNGCGGLRDYQNLLWCGFFVEGVITTGKLVEKKIMNESERRLLDKAYDFLLRVRTELHYQHKRPTDVLTLYFQGQIANQFNYPQKNVIRRSEAFMRDYYFHARHIFLLTQTIFDRMAIPQTRAQEKKTPAIFNLLAKRPKKVEEFDGFYNEGGMLYPLARDIFTIDPHRLMRLFQHAQQRELSLSPELQQLVRRRLRLVNRTFQYSKPARETFEAILSRKGQVGRILRMMHEVDFLGAYIPEFGQLTCLVQHEFFHRYTADEHTLVCIEKLDELIDTEDPKMKDYRLLFQKIEDPFTLYLALLLHDTGKAANVRAHADASATFAMRVAARHQIGSTRSRSLVLLVDHHVTLSETAQRRNLDDVGTVKEFAEIFKSQSNLDALMLLTLADGKGTSDESWSDWKESLVWQLYRSTTRYLSDGVLDTSEVSRKEVRVLVARKMAKDYADEIDAHFTYMPERYFRTMGDQEMVQHLRLFRTFFETSLSGEVSPLVPAVKWIDHPERSHSELQVCTWDRRELLARIAGSISVAGLNILSADIFTRGDNLVLDIFRVCDTNFNPVSSAKDRTAVEKGLHQALEKEEFDFTPVLTGMRKTKRYYLSQEVDFPTKITVSNHASPHYTLVEIVTPDRLGLLYDLLRAFGSVGVDIALSRISTEKGAAIDSFYITDGKGRKILADTPIATLQRILTRAATGTVATKSGAGGSP